MSEEISLLEIVMIPQGFGVRVHPDLMGGDMELVRKRISEMLPVLGRQILNPTEETIAVNDGEVSGAMTATSSFTHH